MGLRILHCITSVNPAGGGPIEGLKQLAAVKMLHGHTVEIVTLDDPDSPWVRECPLRCHCMGPALGSYHYSFRLVPWLREHRRDYDVVIVNGIWQFGSFATWRALHGSDTPYLVFTHGMLDPWFRKAYPLKHLKKCLYWPWAEYRVLRDAAAVLFTCEEERRLARQSFWPYACRERVVNYGTSAPPGDPAVQREAFLRQFPGLRHTRNLLFLGRVHEKKGPDLLFRAFAALVSGPPDETTKNLHLVMAGPNDHSYGRRMKSLADSLGIARHVTWTGMLGGDLKWGAFRCAEAFVLPSHQENFGIAVAEALACGVPVLISRQVNIWPEIVADGTGYAETDDLAGTSRLLRQWLDTPAGQRELMRSRTQPCFEQRYTIDRASASLVEAIEEVVPKY